MYMKASNNFFKSVHVNHLNPILSNKVLESKSNK